MTKTPERLWKGEELAVYEYLECGALQHNWILVESKHWEGSFGEKITRRCIQCNAERRQLVMRDSRRVLSNYYVYPPRYRFAKGERPSRLDMLLMMTDTKRRKRFTREAEISHTKPTALARREVKGNGR